MKNNVVQVNFELAREDKDGTAKPKTEIVGRFPAGGAMLNFAANAKELIVRPTKEEMKARKNRKARERRAAKKAQGTIDNVPKASGMEVDDMNNRTLNDNFDDESEIETDHATITEALADDGHTEELKAFVAENPQAAFLLQKPAPPPAPPAPLAQVSSNPLIAEMKEYIRLNSHKKGYADLKVCAGWTDAQFETAIAGANSAVGAKRKLHKHIGEAYANELAAVLNG